MKSSDVTCILLIVAGMGIYLLLNIVAGHDPKTGIVSVFTLAALAQVGTLNKRIAELESAEDAEQNRA